MTLGQRLYEMRKSKGLSQESVAEVLGVTRQTVSKWETDQTTPDFDKIIPICKLYNITTDELFNDNMTKTEASNNTKNDYDYSYNSSYNYAENNSTENYGNRYETPYEEPVMTADERENFEKGRRRSAAIMAVSICMYIMSVVPFFLFDNSRIMMTVFFAIIAVATMLIVFAALSRPKNIKKFKVQTKETRLFKQITSILSGIILVIYMIISFATGAWHITWILWVIYGIMCEIIKLIFSLKGSEINDEE